MALQLSLFRTSSTRGDAIGRVLDALLKELAVVVVPRIPLTSFAAFTCGRCVLLVASRIKALPNELQI